ncbi:MAG: gamma-glutamyl-gamma-aminobutyrate hydrolase family protein [bacterium]
MTVRIALALGGNSTVTDECYVRALSAPGLDLEICKLLPGMDEAGVREVVARCSGLVLSGGADVHPARYGQEPAGTEMKSVSVARDAMESTAIVEADRLEMPILAICRGMQMLNVQRGGALLQDIGESHRDGRKQAEKWRPFHSVALDPGTAASAVFVAETVETNSRHHQSLDPARIGEGLQVVGRCPIDGVIEAVEGRGDRFVLGVQWHPENMAIGPEESVSRGQAQGLFAAFAEAAHCFASNR